MCIYDFCEPKDLLCYFMWNERHVVLLRVSDEFQVCLKKITSTLNLTNQSISHGFSDGVFQKEVCHVQRYLETTNTSSNKTFDKSKSGARLILKCECTTTSISAIKKNIMTLKQPVPIEHLNTVWFDSARLFHPTSYGDVDHVGDTIIVMISL